MSTASGRESGLAGNRPRNAQTTANMKVGSLSTQKRAAAADAGDSGKTRAPPPFKIERVRHRQHYLKLLIYGAYGVGKTHLAASAADVPQMRDVILINAESGDLSIPDEWPVDGIPFGSYGDIQQVRNFLRKHCKQRDSNDIEGLRKTQAWLTGVEEEDVSDEDIRRYKTVVIDSLSEIEARCFNQVLGITDDTRLDAELDRVEWSDYGQKNTLMLRLIREFRDLPMHVIFTCGAKYTQDEQRKRGYTLDLTGQLANKAQGFVDMVGYYQSAVHEEQMVRRLNVQPSADGRFDAKHRYSRFKGGFFMDPTIGTILSEVGLMQEE